MMDDRSLTDLLRQLDAIANAPMTAFDRDARARPLLAGLGATPRAVIEALQRDSLTWNRDKAAEFEVPVATWVRAVQAVNAAAPDSVAGLLDCLRRAESATAMLRAGYTPGTDPAGRLTWSRG